MTNYNLSFVHLLSLQAHRTLQRNWTTNTLKIKWEKIMTLCSIKSLTRKSKK